MEETNNIILTWGERRRLVDFIGKTTNTRNNIVGVYIHTVVFPGNEEESIVYIGKANNLYRRQRDHYLCLISGAHRIPMEFRDKNDDDWIPELDNDKYACVVRNEDNYVKLVRQGHKYASNRYVYLSVKDDGWKNNSTKDIERYLLYKYKPYGTKRGKISTPKILFSVEHKNKTWEKAKYGLQVFDDI